MVHFVGAGCGAPDLITLRGARLLEEADQIIYAGSLVNPELLKRAKPGCQIYNSAEMTLEQVIEQICKAQSQDLTTVRLHSGDPCLYGAIREQMDKLDELGIAYQSVPGVSSFCGAAAALHAEYTLPGVSQSVIITRMAGRTPVPEKERLSALASHGTSMVLFLSTGLLKQAVEELLAGSSYTADTPAAIVYKASWPEEQVFHCTVGTLEETAKRHGITRTALIMVGGFLGQEYQRSCLYDPAFTTGYRKGTKE